jgi:hypothetical protein
MSVKLYRFSTDTDEEIIIGLEEVLDALTDIGVHLPEIVTEESLYRDIVVGCSVLKAIRETEDRTGLEGQELLMSTLRGRFDALERERDSEVAEKFAHAVGLPSRLGRRH